MKKGFTLAEMLVALAVIGVIAALTIPIITNTNSKNLKTLYKSVYTNAQIVINELINDISLYPSGELSNNTFCANFFSKVNTINYSSENCSNTFSPDTVPDFPNAVTSNGMRWYGMHEDFADCPTTYSGLGLPAGNCIKVSIDINGPGKGTNNPATDDDSRDILHMYIYDTGKITVPSTSKEYEYLTN